MSSHTINYQKLFDYLPDMYLIIAPDAPRFTLVDANEAHMRTTGLSRDQFVGKGLFEVWPDTSQSFIDTGSSELLDSLNEVIRTAKPHEMGLIRYDLPDGNGGSITKFWKPVHYPKLDAAGNVRFIIQSNRDMTDEMVVKNKLELAQAQLDKAFMAGMVGAWTWDIANNIVIADKSLAAMFGVEEEEALRGLPLSVFIASIHPEDRPRVQEAISAVIADGNEYEVEYRTIGVDGSIRWVIARGEVIRDDKGVATNFPGVLVDITDRKAAEHEMIASKAELQFMAESMPQMLFTANKDGVVEYLNVQWSEYTGVSLDTLKKKGWSTYIHPDDRKATTKRWHQAVANGSSYQIEHRIRSSDGSYRWHLTRASAMHSAAGKVIKWVGTNTDITEKKQVEINLEFLSESSKLLSSSLEYESNMQKVADLAVKTVSDWCSIELYDKESQTIKLIALEHGNHEKLTWAHSLRPERIPVDDHATSGSSFVLMTGETEYYPTITEQMILDAPISDAERDIMRSLDIQSLISVPLKIHDEVVGVLTLISAEQKRHYNHEDLEMVEELGHRLSLSMTNAMLFDDAHREIELRKKLEKQLLSVNEKLEARVKKRTEQLEILNVNLERSNKELQNFAYVASHDLQEPLRKIQAFGNLLSEDYGDKLDDGKDYLDRMRNAAARMSILIEDLLEFSRVTTQAKPFTEVNLNTVAAEVIDDLETRIASTDGTVTVGDLPTLEADETQMRQLLQNLIGNALKFHRQDIAPEVSVFIQKKPNTSDTFELHIKDNGIGFDEKYLDRIFSVFQRLHTRDEYEGTGIGLAVCRKIVERHGGLIKAHSEPGGGAEFIITLPRKQEKE